MDFNILYVLPWSWYVLVSCVETSPLQARNSYRERLLAGLDFIVDLEMNSDFLTVKTFLLGIF